MELRRTVAVMASAMLVAACGGGDDAAEEPDRVQTVDAADIADLRAGLSGPAEDDAQPSVEDEPAVTTFPEITDETLPVEDGVFAVRSPTGVLLAVTGRTVAGRVVTTPCGNTTVLAGGDPVTDIQVVIDPGHGGDEAGAADVPELTEAMLNLDLARRTVAELEARSITAAMTRDADYRIPIRQRAALADAIAPEIFISIHHNTPASRPSSEPGTEVYVQEGSAESARLGGLLYEEVMAALSTFDDVEWTARDDAGVLVVLNDEGEDAYGIARYPTTPSALVEMAYLGNPSEAAMLATPEYLEVGAVALADGIERYLTSEAVGTAAAEQPRIFNPGGLTGGTTGCIDPALE